MINKATTNGSFKSYFESALSDGTEEFGNDFGAVIESAGLLSQKLTAAFLHKNCYGIFNGVSSTPTAEECQIIFDRLFEEMLVIKSRLEANEAQFGPGFYWVGDLCYVIENEETWRKIASDINGNAYQKVDGLELAILPTTVGDGVFEDQQGREYGVDSGTLGCVAAASVGVLDKDDPCEGECQGGHVVYFSEPFSVGYVDCQISFGTTIEIDVDA